MRTRMCCLAALALAALAAGCGGKAPQPIRIGHLAPLSGPDRAAGEHARQGTQLAVEEWNADEANGPGRKVAVLHVDAHEDEAAQAEAVRLLSVNRVVALIAGPDGALAETAARAAGPYEAAVVLHGELAAPPAGVFAVGASPPSAGGRWPASPAATSRPAAPAC